MCTKFIGHLWSVFQTHGISVKHALFHEAGHGKGICDLMMSWFKGALDRQIDCGACVHNVDDLMNVMKDVMRRDTLLAKATFVEETLLAELTIERVSQVCLVTYTAGDQPGHVGLELRRSALSCASWQQDVDLSSFGGTMEGRMESAVGTFEQSLDLRSVGRQLATVDKHSPVALSKVTADNENVVKRLHRAMCPVCPHANAFDFPSIAEAETHVRTHFRLGAPCSATGHHGGVCARRYAKMGHFLRHVLRKHIGVSYQCATCKKTFLDEHVASACCEFERLLMEPVAEVGPWSCPYCLRVYQERREAFCVHVENCKLARSTWKREEDGKLDALLKCVAAISGGTSACVPPHAEEAAVTWWTKLWLGFHRRYCLMLALGH